MGGYGSGRRSRRPVAEECYALRVRALREVIQHASVSAISVTGQLVWQRTDHPPTLTTYRVAPTGMDSMALTLDEKSGAVFASESLTVVATPQPLGGRRWWLRCPGCQRRVGALFAVGRWRCRRCARATYRSSCQSDKRLGPLLRAFEQCWLGEGPDPLDASPAARHVAYAAHEEHRPAHISSPTANLHLLLKAQALALTRLRAGRPLYRVRASPKREA